MARRSNGNKGGKDDFDQGGPDGPRARQKAADAGADTGSQYDIKAKAERLAKGLEAIEQEYAKIDAKVLACKRACAPEREEIKAIKKALVEAGVARAKVLNATIRQRRLEQKIEHITDDLDDEDKEEFMALEDALADFGDADNLFGAAVEAEAKKAERSPEPVH